MISTLVVSISIIIGALISEDAALFGSLALYKQGTLSLFTACFASTIGIIVGDLGLFYLGYYSSKKRVSALFSFFGINNEKIIRVKKSKWSYSILFLARFIPGTRLPSYFGAGLLRIQAPIFVAIIVVSTLIWVGLATIVTTSAFKNVDPLGFWIFTLLAISMSLIISRSSTQKWKIRYYQFTKNQYYEFWPMWLFYPPVVIYYLIIGIKHKNFSYPLYANPGIQNSGIIGESKFEILSQVSDSSPTKLMMINLDPKEHPHTVLLEKAKNFIQSKSLNFPIILKPDVGQRGSGVVLIQNATQLVEEIKALEINAILQESAAYSEEVGINYTRLPHEKNGKITGITRKRFPNVIGNGKSTLSELILKDPRARYLAPLYFTKHSSKLAEVIPKNDSYTLAKIGNHCQGTLFEDGKGLIDPKLELAIDEIAQNLSGFFVGRFDIRFRSENELKDGSHFKIIEINGAAGEATHIYDRKMKLTEAYQILFAQIRTLFEIGEINRKRNPTLKTKFWSELSNYRKLQKNIPKLPERKFQI